jgi:hypothetical protein
MLGRWSEGRRPRVRPHQPGTRDALGNRPPPLREAAPCWAGRGRTKAAKAAGSGGRRVRCPRPGSTVPRRKIAAMERREARHPSPGCPRLSAFKLAHGARACLRGVTVSAPLGAPSPSHVARRELGRRRARAAKNRAGGAMLPFVMAGLVPAISPRNAPPFQARCPAQGRA